ncbi:MAG: hypothetical protein WA140_11995 [Geobacteraceae bacterium]
MNAMENVKTKLKPGQLYRRADLEKLSRSVDRDVAGLVNEGVLVKVGSGLYNVRNSPASACCLPAQINCLPLS